jgi:oligopeptidase B
VVLDLEALARGKSFIDLGVFEVSDDGNFLAYAIDEVGDENYTLRIKDLTTGKHGPEVLPRVTSAAWSADGRELLYTVRDDTFRAYALRSRTRGADGGDRLVVAREGREVRPVDPAQPLGRVVAAGSDAAMASEVRVARATQSSGAWTTIAAREAGHLYDVDHFGDTFYVRTNRGAPFFRVVMAPESDPRPLRWKELVPERAGVAIAEIAAFSGHLALIERDRGMPRIGILDLRSGRRIRGGDPQVRGGGAAQTQAMASIAVGENPDPWATSIRVHVESVDMPERTIDVAFSRRRRARGPRARAGRAVRRGGAHGWWSAAADGASRSRS